MSSFTVSQSPRVSMFLSELLAAEKENTRVWLRAEFDRLVDPLVDSIFDRLETKLKDGLERESGDDGDCAEVNQNFVDQTSNVPQSATFLYQPSTSTFFVSSFKPISSHLNYQNVTPNSFQTLPTETIQIDPRSQSFSTSTVQSPPLSTNAQIITLPNQLTNVQSGPIPSKQEIGATANEPMAKAQSALSLSGPIVNEQPIYYIDYNDIFANWNEEDEVEFEECVRGIEVYKEDDIVKSIEDDQQLSPPSKKPKIEPTQGNSVQAEVEFPRRPTDEAQPNQENKQFITVHLQCPQSDCLDTFPEEQLNLHMWTKHLLGPLRCVVKDCAQSFGNKTLLSDHLKQAHHSTSQWHCGKCAKHYTTYHQLSVHHLRYHQLGQFQCSFPACKFMGEYRVKMFDHYAYQHKPTLKCPHPDCSYETTKASNFKQHQRTHLGSRPYQCKWPHCKYAAKQKAHLTKHIRGHASSVPNGEQLNPNDYVDVVHGLL